MRIPGEGGKYTLNEPSEDMSAATQICPSGGTGGPPLSKEATVKAQWPAAFERRETLARGFARCAQLC